MLLCQETSGLAWGVCHLREAVLQRLTSWCLAWLSSTLFPSTLSGAVCRQWNGLAKPVKQKYSRRRPAHTSQAQHPHGGQVGTHASVWPYVQPSALF